MTTDGSTKALQRIGDALRQYRHAPFRSADWLANELMTIFDKLPANDIAPDAEEVDAEVARILALTDDEVLAEAEAGDVAWARGFKRGVSLGKNVASTPAPAEQDEIERLREGLNRKGVENYYRAGFRAARYFFDPSVDKDETTPEEEDHVKWFMDDYDRLVLSRPSSEAIPAKQP